MDKASRKATPSKKRLQGSRCHNRRGSMATQPASAVSVKEMGKNENGKKTTQECPLSLQRALKLKLPEAQVVELHSLFEALLRHLTDGRIPLLSKEDFPKRLDYAVKQGWLKRAAFVYRSNDIRNAIVHRAVDKPFPSVAQVTSARDIFRNAIRKLAEVCDPTIRHHVLRDEPAAAAGSGCSAAHP